jgi:hypothetical protein
VSIAEPCQGGFDPIGFGVIHNMRVAGNFLAGGLAAWELSDEIPNLSVVVRTMPQ